VQSIQVTLTRRTDAHESNVQPPTPADAENTPPLHTRAPASARPSLVRIDPPRHDGALRPLHPPPASSTGNAAPPPSEATDAAIDAVRSARFTPAMRNGEATGAWLEIPIRFRIETR